MAPIKNHLVACLGEFIGTFLFLFFAFGGTQTAASASGLANDPVPNVAQLLYVALIFGFSLAINVWAFFRVSGGLFNPVVTLALVLIGAVGPFRALFIFVAQIVGGIAAAAAVRGLTPGNEVFFAVRLSQGVTKTQGLFLEMFFTVLLVFVILMLAAEKTKATFIAPVGIGLALFVAELFGVYYTGGALNPARAFGPAVIDGFESSQWVYWIGPLLGALLAVTIYKVLKILHYEEVNGNQDLSEFEEQKIAEKEAEREEKRRQRHQRKSVASNRHSVGANTLMEQSYAKGDDLETGHGHGHPSGASNVHPATRASMGSQHHTPRQSMSAAPVSPVSARHPAAGMTPTTAAHYAGQPVQYDYNGNPIVYQVAPNPVPISSTGPYILHQQTAPRMQDPQPPRRGSRREERI